MRGYLAYGAGAAMGRHLIKGPIYHPLYFDNKSIYTIGIDLEKALLYLS